MWSFSKKKYKTLNNPQDNIIFLSNLCKNLEQETLHLKMCKYSLGVNKKTITIGVLRGWSLSAFSRNHLLYVKVLKTYRKTL